MKSALVIFNGIRFPFYLADHAIAWAKTNNANLHALFIKAKDEVKEGYVFPSDLDAAENLADDEDTEKANILVIRSQMKVLEDMAKTKDIPYNSELLTDPSLGYLLGMAKRSDILFMDADYHETGILFATSFNMKELVKKSPCPVEAVKAKT
jgi:hypothetical protein